MIIFQRKIVQIKEACSYSIDLVRPGWAPFMYLLARSKDLTFYQTASGWCGSLVMPNQCRRGKEAEDMKPGFPFSSLASGGSSLEGAACSQIIAKEKFFVRSRAKKSESIEPIVSTFRLYSNFIMRSKPYEKRPQDGKIKIALFCEYKFPRIFEKHRS